MNAVFHHRVENVHRTTPKKDTHTQKPGPTKGSWLALHVTNKPCIVTLFIPPTPGTRANLEARELRVCKPDANASSVVPKNPRRPPNAIERTGSMVEIILEHVPSAATSGRGRYLQKNADA